MNLNLTKQIIGFLVFQYQRYALQSEVSRSLGSWLLVTVPDFPGAVFSPHIYIKCISKKDISPKSAHQHQSLHIELLTITVSLRSLAVLKICQTVYPHFHWSTKLCRHHALWGFLFLFSRSTERVWFLSLLLFSYAPSWSVHIPLSWF